MKPSIDTAHGFRLTGCETDATTGKLSVLDIEEWDFVGSPAQRKRHLNKRFHLLLEREGIQVVTAELLAGPQNFAEQGGFVLWG